MAIDTLSCPTCPERMRPVPNQPPPMFACPGCRAVWVGSNTLRKLSRTELPALQVVDGTTRRACAQCQNTMLTSSMGPIAVEYCSGCDAVFFDMGELESLLPKGARPQSAPVSNSTVREVDRAPAAQPAGAPGTQFLCAVCKTLHPRFQARQSHRGPVCQACASREKERAQLAKGGAIDVAPSVTSDWMDDEDKADLIFDVLDLLGSLITTFVERD